MRSRACAPTCRRTCATRSSPRSTCRAMPILTYTVASSRLDDEALSWFVDNDVAKSLLTVRGVGAVTRVGGVTREVRVEVDPLRLLALNATVADISRQLRQIQQEASGGRADLGGAEQSVRTIATRALGRRDRAHGHRAAPTAGASASTRSPRSSDTVAEQRSAALLDGKPVVGFEIARARGSGEVEVAEGVRAQLEKLKAEHPHVQIVEAFNFVDPVLENYKGSMTLLLRGRAARGAGGVAVPARLARDPGLGGWRCRCRSSRRSSSCTCSASALNVVTLLGAVARGRHPRRRRDRRDREHRAPHAHGQAAASRRRSTRPTRSAWRSSPPP